MMISMRPLLRQYALINRPPTVLLLFVVCLLQVVDPKIKAFMYTWGER